MNRKHPCCAARRAAARRPGQLCEQLAWESYPGCTAACTAGCAAACAAACAVACTSWLPTVAGPQKNEKKRQCVSTSRGEPNFDVRRGRSPSRSVHARLRPRLCARLGEGALIGDNNCAMCTLVSDRAYALGLAKALSIVWPLSVLTTTFGVPAA